MPVLVPLQTHERTVIIMSDIFMSKFDKQLHRRGVLEGAFSTMEVHNHLNGAYHAADMYRFAPPRELMWRIPAFVVPSKVREHVHADEMADQLRANIANARKLVMSQRKTLDRPCSAIINHMNGRTGKSEPYADLHAGITVKATGRPTYQLAWQYTFNAYEVAMSMLHGYLSFIDTTMASRHSDFTKLSRIHEQAKKYQDSASLVAGQFG